MARKSISILDNDYIGWIKELSSRYRRSQIKVATKVNAEMLRFYWELGRDIVEMQIENRWGEGVIKNLSSDLQRELPGTHCFSRTNLYYMKKFYLLYRHHVGIVQQVAGQLPEEPEAPKVQQIAGLLQKKLSLAENSEAYSAKLLICKEKDKVQAQYALESSTQPIAISEYDLEKFYPEKIEGTIPTIEEIEKGLETHK